MTEASVSTKLTSSDAMKRFVMTTLMELADGGLDHRQNNDAHSKTPRVQLLAKYNWSIDAFVSAATAQILTKLEDLAAGKNDNFTSDTEWDDDCRYEFNELVFDIFVEATEFYELQNLHGDDRDEYMSAFFEVVTEHKLVGEWSEYLRIY